MDRATVADKASWEYVSQQADPAEVLTWLEQQNLLLPDLNAMAWRLKDSSFYEKAAALLRSRHIWHPTTASYAFLHHDTRGIADYLEHQDAFLTACGPAIQSDLLTIDPVARHTYQHLEYSPLINARAHQLGAERTILNDKFRAQYEAFLRVLACRAALSHDDCLAAAGYLALQDRIEEARAFFTRVDRARTASPIPYDYFQAWLAMSAGDTATARKLTAAYRPMASGLPENAAAAGTSLPPHWAARFAELTTQLDEIDGKPRPDANPADRESTQEQLAAVEPSCTLSVENRTISLNYRNLKEATVNYYPMDLEFLFSANPFVTQDTSRFRMIRPNKTEHIQLPAGASLHTIPLPREYQSANVLVEVTGGGLTVATAAYANELDVTLSPGAGRLQVQHAGDHRPLSGVYVKVFARKNDTPVFYKDGYTDLRGKFDYATLSTSDLDGTTRFSILIMSPEHGATVKEVQPPAR